MKASLLHINISMDNAFIYHNDFGFSQRFTARFEAEQVGILELPYMTEERLQSLGIPLGPRIRIMEESRKIL
mgnify:CR=1 FL=1